MRFTKVLLPILVTLFLQGCISPKMSEELVAGKMQFTAGNYKQSFHQLLPIAAYGDKEAQYAVGYMYYYGIGTAQDCESGLFWMKKSADQGYTPAIGALRIIEGPPEPEKK